MKKLISIILVCILVLSLAACGGDSKANVKGNSKVDIKDEFAGQFRVGYGKVDIMVYDEEVALAGYGNTEKRLSTGYLDILYAICIAVSDKNDNTALFFGIDNIGISEANVEKIMKAINEATGVPAGNIFLNCSHTHSGPDTNTAKVGANVLYINTFPEKFTTCAVEALNDRKPAEAFFGIADTFGYNFTRHYFGKDNGEIVAVGDNHNSDVSETNLIGHTTDNDKTLRVIRFKRENAKTVYYVNFRAHATLTGGSAKYDISADFAGAIRDALEKQDDCLVAYFQGAAGNQNPTSRISSENANKSKDKDVHGEAIAKYILDMKDSMIKVNTDSGIKTSKFKFTGKINHSEDNLVGGATIVQNAWTTTNNSSTCVSLGKPFGIFSPYHAGGIINKSRLGLTNDFMLYTAQIGEIGLTYAPFEQFDTNSSEIYEASPYKYTICQGYTNGKQSYIPSAFGYEYRCYESDVGRYAPGTGEEVANKFAEMLKKQIAQ